MAAFHDPSAYRALPDGEGEFGEGLPGPRPDDGGAGDPATASTSRVSPPVWSSVTARSISSRRQVRTVWPGVSTDAPTAAISGW